MSFISNQLTITGEEEEIQRFIVNYHRKDGYWLIPHMGDVKCDRDDEPSCRVKFTTKREPPLEWLAEVRPKYPSLEFSMMWSEQNDVTCCGFVESDGRKYEITSREDFKRACKLLQKHKAPVSQLPSTPVMTAPPPAGATLTVTQLGQGLYRDTAHNLVIKMGDRPNEFICIGYYNNNEITLLTPEKIEVCKQFGLRYIAPPPKG